MRCLQNSKVVFPLLLLLCLPTSVFADSFSFFAPPASDISLQIMQAIFGTGTDDYNGKLIRPLLLVLCSGAVIFMGAIFSWNLVKFVLHTSQQGEMMVGKGKELGLVMIRSVFGISMVLPIYSGAYKGLCIAYIFVAWLITQGIGLADRGTNAVVDYLTAGGTIYQVAQSSKDTQAKQAMSAPALDILSAETCMYSLRAAQKTQDQTTEETNKALEEAGSPATGGSSSSAADIYYAFTPDGKKVNFGTRNLQYPTSGNQYFNECGTITLPLSSDSKKANQNYVITLATQQLISDLMPFASRITSGYPDQKAQFNNEIPPYVGNAILNYSNVVAPVRTQANDAATQAAYDTLNSIKDHGWIILGAYYPMMGNLNQENKAALSGFQPTASEGSLSSGQANPNANSAYNVANLTQDQKSDIKNQFSYIGTQEDNVKTYIYNMDTGNITTTQEELGYLAPDSSGGKSNDYFSGYFNWLDNVQKSVSQNAPDAVEKGIPEGEASKGTGWLNDKSDGYGTYTIKGVPIGVDPALGGIGVAGDQTASFLNKMGVSDFFKSGDNSGVTFGGTLNQGRLKQSSALVGLASAPGGPVIWATMIPALVVFVDIIAHFRDAIDQTQHSDPLLALQDFGFYVMDKAVKLILIILGGTFVATMAFGWIPSVNPATGVSAGGNLEASLMMLFFTAFAAAGIGFGVYIPSIPFIVWMSAILGWIGHSFQAIVGAPLVALRMTTAEGEGLLGGAVEGVMMLLGLLFTPFLLVVGFTGALILIKQLMILVNYLFSIFAYYSFVSTGHINSFAWIVIGVPAILFIYFSIVVTVVQSVCTKLIGELPGEVLRHLHSAMTGHKAAEQMSQRMEQTSEKMGGSAGDMAGKTGAYRTDKGIHNKFGFGGKEK